MLRFTTGIVRSIASLVIKRIERQDLTATGVARGQDGLFLLRHSARRRFFDNSAVWTILYLSFARLFPPVNVWEAPAMDPPDGPLEKLCSWERRVCSCLTTKVKSAQDHSSDSKYSADPVRRTRRDEREKPCEL